MDQVAERKKKFFLMLPLFVIPLFSLLFYGLGGGQKKAKAQVATGLNATLPAAQLTEEGLLDKLSLYRQAEKDSQRLREASDQDAYTWKDSSSAARINAAASAPLATSLPATFSTPAAGDPAHSEAKIQQRLELLEQLVQHPDTATPAPPPVTLPAAASMDPQNFARDLLRESAAGTGATGDPELQQLEGMLEKIIDIQHPERLQEKLKQASVDNKTAAFAVTTDLQAQPVAELLDGKQTLSVNNVQTGEEGSFFELPHAINTPVNNAVRAVVHESQTLVSGATIKIRLEQNAYVQGVLIPAGSFVYGHCQLQSDRLQVSIPSIRYGNSIFPVSLQVYDTDGLPGIRIPGSVSRDAAKDGSQQAMQALAMGSLDPSLAAQAASAGIETAKNLLSRKIRLIKVTVKADHPVLLVSN